MSGRVLLVLTDKLRVTDDLVQWRIERWLRAGPSGWRPASFCCTKPALLRLIAERGVEMSDHAAAVLEGLPQHHPGPDRPTITPKPRRLPAASRAPAPAAEPTPAPAATPAWGDGQRRALPDSADGVPPSDLAAIGYLLEIPKFLRRDPPPAHDAADARDVRQEAAA